MSAQTFQGQTISEQPNKSAYNLVRFFPNTQKAMNVQLTVSTYVNTHVHTHTHTLYTHTHTHTQKATNVQLTVSAGTRKQKL